MDIKEEQFESFIVIEDGKKEKNLKKSKIQNLKSSKKKKDTKPSNKNDILIYDENTKKK